MSLQSIPLAALSLFSVVALQATDITPGDVTANLGPDFFFDDAVIGGNNNDSAVFIRDIDGPDSGLWNQGATLTLTGLGWASRLATEWTGPTYAVATFIDLGPNRSIGGGDDIILGTVTDDLVLNTSSGSEYYWAFDSAVTGTMTGPVLRVQIEGFNGSDNPSAISRKTPNSNTSQSGVKLSLAGTATGGTVVSTLTASSSGFWDTISWSKNSGGSTGADLGDNDTIIVGDYDTVTYRGVPASETVAEVRLGENSTSGQATLVINAGALTVSSSLEVGRSNTLNDAFLEVSGGSLSVGGSGFFGRDAEAADGSLILSGGTVSFGGNLQMGDFEEGGSMLRFHNPGSSSAVQVGGTLLLERVALDLTFDGSYSHVPGTVISLVEYAARDGQFGNFRDGDDFNAGANRFRIDYDVPSPGGLSITLTALENWSTASTPPNIIFVFSDDQGYSDLSTNEHPNYGDLYPMPELDLLAASGTRFSDAYVSSGVCHPSRVGLMLGQHQQRFGSENNWAPGDAIYDGLPLSEATVPRRLQGLGYRTYGIGKWHLGETVEFHPNVRGFDRWYGMWGGSRSFYTGTSERHVFQDQMTPDFAGETGQYLTDRIGDSAVDFIDEHLATSPAQPFYMYVSFTAVHAPMDIVSGDARFTRLQNEFGLTASDYQNSPITFGAGQSTVDQNRYELAAMTLAMDENIGKIVDKVAAEGLASNTIILYMTDNGGAAWSSQWGGNYSYNLPLKGSKGNSSEEGSIRVPTVIAWPNTIPAGQTLDAPVTSLDFMATFVNAAGAPAAARNRLDGLDLLPLIAEGTPLPDERVIPFRMAGVNDGGTALRQGDWKLYSNDSSGSTTLYNLRSDIGETSNLSGTNPEIKAALQARLDAWEAAVLPPLYREGMMQLDSGLIRYPIRGGLRLKNDSTTVRWISGDLRTGVSLGADFQFGGMLRATESTHATGAQLWYGIGDTTNRSRFIRFGIDFENNTLHAIEGKSGTSNSTPITFDPQSMSDLRADYDASSGTFTVSFSRSSTSIQLQSSYGAIDTFAMGAAAMEGELTVLAPVREARIGDANSGTLSRLQFESGVFSFTADFPSDPSTGLELQRSTSLDEAMQRDIDALLENIGGGQYTVTTQADAAASSEFFKLASP